MGPGSGVQKWSVTPTPILRKSPEGKPRLRLSATACFPLPVAADRSQGTRVDRTSSVGHTSTPGLTRLTRPTDAEDPGTYACAGTGSGEASGDTAADGASWSWSADSTSLRVGDRNSAALSLRQADRQLSHAAWTEDRQGSDGAVPEEKSSGDRRRMGLISKQGNVLLRFLLVEAQPEWRSKFFHLAETGGASVLDVVPGLRRAKA